MSGSAGNYPLGGSSPAAISSRSVDDAVAAATTFFVVMILVGIHTGVGIMSNDTLIVPFIVSFVAAIGVIVIHADAINAAVMKWFVLFFSVVLALAVIASVLNGAFTDHLRASAYFIYNVIIGYATFLGLSKMGAKRVETTFFWFAVVLIVGAVLEVYGPIRPLSDAFRNAFESWHGVYSSDYRDVAQFGAIRPKFFGSEPSSLGLTTALSLYLWCSAKRRINFSFLAQAFFLFGAAVFLIRSPTLIFAPLSYFLVYMMTRSPKNRLGRSVRFLIPLLYMMVVLLIPLISLYALLEFKNKPTYMLTGSFFGRVIAPPFTAWKALLSYPIWGIGLGNEDALAALVVQAFGGLGALMFIERGELATNIANSVCNALYSFWIFLGLGGGLIMLGMMGSFLRVLRVPVSRLGLMCVAAGTFWQGFGSPNTPIAWFVVFSLAAMCTLRLENHKAARR